MDSRTKPSVGQVIVLQKRGGKAPLKVSDHNCLLLNKSLVGQNGSCIEQKNISICICYGLLICDSSDCALHKISFHTDHKIPGWCYSMEDAAHPAGDVINHQHSFLLCQTGQGAQ